MPRSSAAGKFIITDSIALKVNRAGSHFPDASRTGPDVSYEYIIRFPECKWYPEMSRIDALFQMA